MTNIAYKTPQNDYIFKKIFGTKGNEEILKKFLEAILEEKIEKVTVDLQTEVLAETIKEKGVRLDVRARLDNKTEVNIEIQLNKRGFSEERCLEYWSRIYQTTVEKGKDYMKREIFANTCPLEYYLKAVDIIKDRVEDPVFYVFTDNPDWVKENLKGIDYTLVEDNPAIGWGNHFDMQLMSCCKHNIIANSTYSWWGAFLNDNPNKIVIEPRYWFNPMIEHYRKRENNTACEGWIII